MDLQRTMFQELESKKIFEQAQKHAHTYIDNVDTMNAYPSQKSIKQLDLFDEAMPVSTSSAEEVLNILQKIGTTGTVGQTGGRYFGFVNGGALPVTLAVKWLTDVWDQCGGLYLTSPVNAKLESVSERWLKELFNLPESTVAGFVTGTSMANLCGLAAARYYLLDKQGWNVNEFGMNGAPKVRVLAHDQVHASVKKTLAMLGFGKAQVERIPADRAGRIDVQQLPKLDSTCLILLQAGNVNTGAFDNFMYVCERANKVDAWVHIDGAFGLWAAASERLKHLTEGISLASSWAVDGHKTLNTPYDSGIAFCKHPQAMVTALQATGDYLQYDGDRQPLFYTPEMSKRSRVFELWAALKYLGKQGVDKMVYSFHEKAKSIAEVLRQQDFEILNDVEFNQVLVRFQNDDITNKIIKHIQQSGTCWLGGTTWNNQAAIRISLCSWKTTDDDLNQLTDLFVEAKNLYT